ncbi:MAG: YpdA family putative bacillithiol disulfide reductase [Acidobacteriota bacterium]
MDQTRDLLIIGAGPAGLACAVYARNAGLDTVVVEKGCIVNSIYHYPENMTFFTTAELLEIGNIPMTVAAEKPKRLDALKYYRRVSEHFELDLRDFEKVLTVSGRDLGFTVETEGRFDRRRQHRTRKIVVATGYYDNPNLLGIPGEDLPKVSHYYHDAHPYYRKKVVVIGGKNSAAIAALELFRNGAEVTLVHRGHDLGREIKYWIRPDIKNRISNGEVTACFKSRVVDIRVSVVVLSTPAGNRVFENDFVFALTGYHPDPKLRRGITVAACIATSVDRGRRIAGETLCGRLKKLRNARCWSDWRGVRHNGH